MNPAASILRAFAALIMISTLVFAVDFGRGSLSISRTGELIEKSQKIEACLAAPDAVCKLAGPAAQAKTKAVFAPFVSEPGPRLTEADPRLPRDAFRRNSDSGSPHLAATMVLRV